MLLYSDDKAPNPRRVRIFLAEKGIEVETVNVEILQGEHQTESFAQKSPLQRLPFLELDYGTQIFETIAICQYIEALHQEPNLMGQDDLEKALITMRQRQIEMEFFHRVQHAFRHSHPALAIIEQPQIKEWAEANKPKAEKVLDWVEGLLGEHDYCAGDRFTIADITLLCAIDFAKNARLNIFEGRDKLSAWYQNVSTRPSAGA
jgi:glutathione S-transferase